MKIDGTLESSYSVHTLGYYEVNDGGAADYRIREKTESDVEDGGSIHFLDNGLVAELIAENEVNPIQFGAKCNDTTDDANSLRNAINFLNSKGGGTLNLLDNKTYTLNSVQDNCFIMLKDNVNIIGTSTLKIKDNYGDWQSLFFFDNNINNIVLRDFTVDENSINNAPTGNTGSEGAKRTTFRLLANNDYYIKNALFENIKINDCLGVWQYEFEGKCENVKLDKCIINYNSTHLVDYDRTSIYLGVNDCTVTNCVLNGSDNARTAVELHGHNIIVTDNIITNYRSGIYIVNDTSVPYNTENKLLLVANNKIEARYRGILNWFSFDDMTTESVVIHNNYVRILNGETSSTIGIGLFDKLGTGSIVNNLKIHDNIICSENTLTDGIRFVSTTSSADCLIANLEIYNNLVEGKFNMPFRLASNANNTFKINNLMVENNKFVVDNDVTNTCYFLLRQGIKNIVFKNNHFKFNGTPTYLFRTAGAADDELTFNILDNICDYNFMPSYLISGDVRAIVKHRLPEVKFLNSSGKNVFALTTLACKIGSIIYDNHFTARKVHDEWIVDYVGNDIPTHIPVFKGSTFRFVNSTNFIQRIALKDGFIADHVTGSNKVGDWVHNADSVVVFESLTNNNLTSATTADTTNFKYIGQLATYHSITPEG